MALFIMLNFIKNGNILDVGGISAKSRMSVGIWKRRRIINSGTML